MPSLPEGWKLRQRKRSDGKVDIVGKNDLGEEYVARTTEGPEVTDRDLEILRVGNREQSTAREFVKFYEKQRDDHRKNWEKSLDDEYMDAAENVVHAGLHLSESRISFCHIPQQKWDAMWEN